MVQVLFVTFALTLAAPAEPSPQAAERAAIEQTALDYIEGWYEGNAERMERAVHPELAKRIVYPDPRSGQSTLNQMGAMTLVQETAVGYGTKIPPEERDKDVIILDIYENAASVKVVAARWIDYMHMAKVNGQWKIVNVLWELRPDRKPKPEKSDEGSVE